MNLAQYLFMSAEHVGVAVQQFRQPRTPCGTHSCDQEAAMAAKNLQACELFLQTGYMLGVHLFEHSSDLRKFDCGHIELKHSKGANVSQNRVTNDLPHGRRDSPGTERKMPVYGTNVRMKTERSRSPTPYGKQTSFLPRRAD